MKTYFHITSFKTLHGNMIEGTACLGTRCKRQHRNSCYGAFVTETASNLLQPLKIKGNAKNVWGRLKEQFELYMKVTEADKLDEEQDSALFLSCGQQSTGHICLPYRGGEGNEEILYEITKMFQDHCVPRKHITYEKERCSGGDQKRKWKEWKCLSQT